MFKIKFPTKRIFQIFHILRINGMAPFCHLLTIQHAKTLTAYLLIQCWSHFMSLLQQHSTHISQTYHVAACSLQS